jgi:iron complex outermembrane receptor protein/hemoglobin/transferrin/lactoferrin receptor protein
VGVEACDGFQYALQPVNLQGRAIMRGVDGVLTLHFPYGFGLRTTLSYAWGEGDNPNFIITDDERVPLSRVPPFNGTEELTWRVPGIRIILGAALRWQALQDRLSPADFNDPRIPEGGTPAYAVVDLRASYRVWRPHMLLSLVLENLADAPYRTHGSGVNGPGRSLSAMLELGF